MQQLLYGIMSANAVLLQNESREDLAIYTRVLDRVQALGCLSRVTELKLFGNGEPDRTHILSDESGTRLLILCPPREEIDTFLAVVGPCLRKLQLFRTGTVQLELRELRDLTELELSDNSLLERICAPEGLPALEYLCLSNTAISSLDGFPLSETLKMLLLDHTKLDIIPDGIRELEGLEHLDLRDLELEELPDWLPAFHLVDVPDGILLHNTRVRRKRIEVKGLSGAELRTVLRMMCGRSMHEYKVILLGDAEAGKTLTLRRLLGDDATSFEDAANNFITDENTYAPADFDHKSTPGVIFEEKKYDLSLYGLGDEQIRVHFWDFGGQDILHSVHSVFLTDRALYVILLNTRNDTQDARARYWLRYLHTNKPNCPVLLVLNKIDQNRNASIDENSLRRKYSCIRDVLELSSLKFNRRRFAEDFTKKLLQTLISSNDLTFSFPAKYRAVRKWMKNQTAPYIGLEDFWKRCRECSPKMAADTEEEINERAALLPLIMDLGLGIHFSENPETRPYVILRPLWITNAIYTILFNMHSRVENGLISKLDIQELLVPGLSPGPPPQQVYPNETYDPHSSLYVLSVMNKFGLSFTVANCDQAFVPMLCRRNTPDYVNAYLDEPHVMRFRYLLNDLPDPKQFKLLAALFHDADQCDIWLTGGRFRWNDADCSAVVMTEDNRIDIYMRPEGTADAARNQLKLLINTINRTITDKYAVRMIGFRFGGQTEFFNFDLLEISRTRNIDVTFSRLKSDLVYIEDILEYRDNSSDRQRIRLLNDVVDVCGQMQRNCHYYKCREDDRNNYISLSLGNRGYRTATQVQSGYGKSLAGPGEIDVQVSSATNVKMSLIEAMNIKTSTSKQYWHDHLNKLVINYNQEGFRYLFLVSYVLDTTDKFDTTCSKYFGYIQKYLPVGHTLKAYNPAFRLEEQSDLQNTKIVECRYATATREILVYHIFVRFWDTSKEKKTTDKVFDAIPDDNA